MNTPSWRRVAFCDSGVGLAMSHFAPIPGTPNFPIALALSSESGDTYRLWLNG